MTVLLNRVPTSQRVAFITIDDGYHTPIDAAEYVLTENLPVTMFLSVNAPAVFENPDYFRQFLPVGHVPQSHGAPHDDLRIKSYSVQESELSHAHHELTRIYGMSSPLYPMSPVIFRPPYGQYNIHTLIVAGELGYRWLVKWTHYVEGSEVRNVRSEPDDDLDCGDIVLCHFDQNLKEQLMAASRAIKAADLKPAYLVEYLPYWATS